MCIEQPVSAMFTLYLERSNLRPASVDFKERACKFFIRWFGDPPVGRVLPATAQSYRAMLGKGRKQTTVQGYLSVFKPFWRWMRANDYIHSDPFAFVSIRVDEQQRREGFSHTDLSLMMMVANPMQRLQICLGLLGCRKGEMFNMQVRDVRLDHPKPHIILTAKDASKKTWPWGTKNHKTGLIAIPPVMRFESMDFDLAEAIRERMAELRQEPEGYLCIPQRYVDRLLGLQAQGLLRWAQIKDPMGNFSRSFRELQKRAGMKEPNRFHELRAAFITAMIDANVPLARIAKAARHARIQQTMKYDRKTDLSIVSDVSQVMENAFASYPSKDS
jgi:integrase